MNFYCPSCKAYYTQPDEQIPSGGLTVKCLDCGTLISLPSPATVGGGEAAGSVPGGEAAPMEELATVSAGPSFEGLGAAALGRSSGSSPGSDNGSGAGGSAQPASSGAVPARVEHADGTVDPDRDDLENELTVPAVGLSSSVIRAIPVSMPVGRSPAAISGKGQGGARADGAAVSLSSLGLRSLRPWTGSHLWLAVRAAASPRRLLETALGLFAILCLSSFFPWLGARSSAPAVGVTTIILGGALGWLTLALLSGGLTASIHRELTSGKRIPLKDGIGWALSHLSSVLLTPLLVVGAGLVLVLLLALLHLVGMIPAAGRVLYGITFGIAMVLSFGAVLSLPLGALVGFYYLPLLQREDAGPWGSLRKLLTLLQEFGGRAIWMALRAGGLGLLLFGAMASIAVAALLLTSAMGLGMLGEDFGLLISRLPGPLGAAVLPLLQLLDVAPGVAASVAVPPSLKAAALLMGFGMLLWMALLAAFLLAYLCGAGLVSFYVLSMQARESR